MTKQTFEELLRGATAEFKGKKKMPTTPAKQFEKGARWLWDVLNRLDKVEPWQESLITELAEKKVRLDALIAEIEETGYLVTKVDKNLNEYKESNPLLVHTKELERTIGMWREHLGLSYKVNPQRMKESPKKNEVDDDDPMKSFYQGG